MSTLTHFDRDRILHDIDQAEEMVARLAVLLELASDPAEQQRTADELDLWSQRLAQLKFYIQ